MESKPVKILPEQVPFQDPLPEEFSRPCLNAHLSKYFDFGPPVIIGRHATQYKDKWETLFAKKAPLCVEIGSGNGFFLSGMAEKFPNRNWLGIEIRYKRVVITAKKLKKLNLSNARILRYDNWSLDELFSESSIDAIFTNHPDPWSKKRQSKKRILSQPFANWAAYAMKPGAEWRIKTDFETHINTMLKVIKDLPFDVVGVSKDAHNDGFPWRKEDDILTNYERKFVEKREPIFALLLRRQMI